MIPGKLCTRCREYLPRHRFGTEPRHRSGLRSHCRTCESAAARAQRAARATPKPARRGACITQAPAKPHPDPFMVAAVRYAAARCWGGMRR